MMDFAQLGLVGCSGPLLDVLAVIEKFAACDHAVLIEGETGTGKELAARAVHYLGGRQRLPFIPVNCGALPEALVESELFGHVRGAFTDARESSPGIISQARGGTLFLDEIEAMATRAQVALLRFLQDKEYRQVGGTSPIASDARIIGATNTDLETMAHNGRFRADLFFRLNVLKVRMPPLRERPGDAMGLAAHFIERLNREFKGPSKRLDPRSETALANYHWPGNIRELENLVLRRYLLEPGGVLWISSVEESSANLSGQSLPDKNDSCFKVAKARAIAAFEQSYITALLAKARGNLSLASRISGKDRSDLAKLLRKHGLQRQQFESR